MKIIMYHYIQEYNKDLPFFNFLHINDFKKQLDYFQNNYYLPSYIEFKKYLSNEIDLPENTIILTFDDGLKCHYEYVLPELKRRNLWGIFYITAGPYIKKKILNVHKIHLLLGRYKPEIIFNKLNTILDKYDNILYKEKIDVLYENQKKININAKTIKMYLNYYIKKENRINITNELFNELFNNIDEDKLIQNFYLTEQEIISLDKCSMIIGNHTLQHLVLSQLNYKQQYEQINEANVFLSNLIDKKIESFCYPYGGCHVYNDITLKILKELNFLFAVDVLFSNRTELNLLKNKYTIYRFDCNKFKNGTIYNYNSSLIDNNINNDINNDINYSNISFKNNMKYKVITVITSNQPRHLSLVNKLAKICDKLYVILECSTIFKKRDGIMKEYFLNVKKSETKIFDTYNFVSNVNILPIAYNDVSKLNIDFIKKLNSELFVVYGSSWIKGKVCDLLEENNTINIHLGVSPYYRGSGTTFWPLYDKKYQYVGGTIHKLVKKLDAGKIIYTVLPKIINCSNVFDFTMSISDITQKLLVEKLKSREIWRIKWESQDNKKEIRNCKGSDFTEEIADEFLKNLPSIQDIKKELDKRELNNFINPITYSISI